MGRAHGDTVSLNDAVLVTGASTGIGYACTLLLSQNGFHVFAGTRTEEDAGRLRALRDVTAVSLDVTDAEQVHDAAHGIHESGRALRGVVNNAGIAIPGPLELLPVDELRRQFEVNFFGAMNVTQACLPMLHANAGRLVFMSSVSGQIASPFVGAYSASKFALEAAADALRMELRGSGVGVSVIEPGNFKTEIWHKGRSQKDRLLEAIPEASHGRYAGALASLTGISQHQERTGGDPDVVAHAVLHALTAHRARARYAVGSPPGWMRRTFTLLPHTVRDRAIMRRLGFE